MHTFDGETIKIHHDYDIKGGNCIIIEKESGNEIRCNGDDLLDFIALYIKNKKISKLEMANTDDIFNIM